MFSTSDFGIVGTATFSERTDKVTLINVDLNVAKSVENHPMRIHLNSVEKGGPDVINLTSIDGSTGKSISEVSRLNDGSFISYYDLIDFNGHINVYLSSNDSTLIAQGDIGQNELDFIRGNLSGIGFWDNIRGTITLTRNRDESTMITVQLTGRRAFGDYAIYLFKDGGDYNESPPFQFDKIVLELNKLNGVKGISVTNVTKLDDGRPITYEEFLDFGAYIGIYLTTKKEQLVAFGGPSVNE